MPSHSEDVASNLFTPKSADKPVQKLFSGFQSDDIELTMRFWQRRVLHLEEQLSKLMEITAVQGIDIARLREENSNLKQRVINIEGGLPENAKKEVNVQSMAKLKEKHNEWKQAQEGDMALVEGKMLTLEKKFEDNVNTRVDGGEF